MRSDLAFLGEPVVYPGHPVTIAYLIASHYTSYETALTSSENGGSWCHALGNSDIPGAGGCVYLAVDLLKKLVQDEMPADQAFAWADEVWGRVDSMKDGGGSFARNEAARASFTKTFEGGQAQANRVKEKLVARLREWPRTAPSSWEGSEAVPKPELSAEGGRPV